MAQNGPFLIGVLIGTRRTQFSHFFPFLPANQPNQPNVPKKCIASWFSCHKFPQIVQKTRLVCLFCGGKEPHSCLAWPKMWFFPAKVSPECIFMVFLADLAGWPGKRGKKGKIWSSGSLLKALLKKDHFGPLWGLSGPSPIFGVSETFQMCVPNQNSKWMSI